MSSFTPTKSLSDQAFERLESLDRGKELLARHCGDLSESDTRAKLIDPIFKEVLGWSEHDIRREEPAAEGYADYVFGAEFAHFHVEAKRVAPRFDMQVPSRERWLKLSGPHLLGRREMKPHLEQAAKYAPDLGTDFAILTNGDQFVVFQTRVNGRSWRDGYAIVYHDYADLLGDFAPFFSLLSSDRVRAGSLMEAFTKTGEYYGTTFQWPRVRIQSRRRTGPKQVLVKDCARCRSTAHGRPPSNHRARRNHSQLLHPHGTF